MTFFCLFIEERREREYRDHERKEREEEALLKLEKGQKNQGGDKKEEEFKFDEEEARGAEPKKSSIFSKTLYKFYSI